MGTPGQWEGELGRGEAVEFLHMRVRGEGGYGHR